MGDCHLAHTMEGLASGDSAATAPSSRRQQQRAMLCQLAQCLASSSLAPTALLARLPQPGGEAWRAHPRQLEAVVACCQYLAAAHTVDVQVWDRLSGVCRAWPRLLLLDTGHPDGIDVFTSRLVAELFKVPQHAHTAPRLLTLLHDLVHNVCSAVNNISKQPDPSSTILIFFGMCRKLEDVPTELVPHVCEALSMLFNIKRLQTLIPEINNSVPATKTKEAVGSQFQCHLLETLAQLSVRLEYNLATHKVGRSSVRVLAPPAVAGHPTRMSLNVDAVHTNALELYRSLAAEFYASSEQATAISASRNLALDAKSMAACILLSAATATSRDKAEKVEAIAQQTLDAAEVPLALLGACRAAIRAIAYLGQHFAGGASVALDTLRRFLCDPSPLLRALVDAAAKNNNREALEASTVLCADAISGISGLIRQASAKQRNAGAAFVGAIAQPRPLSEQDRANPLLVARHSLLCRNTLQLLTSVTEALAVEEPETALQAVNVLYQRLCSSTGPYDTETLLALVRVGAVGSADCFDNVLDMLTTFALLMLNPVPSSLTGHSSSALDASAVYRNFERDDALTHAFQKLFNKAKSVVLKPTHVDKVLSLFVKVAAETLAVSDSIAQAQKHGEKLLCLVQAVAAIMARMDKKMSEDAGDAVSLSAATPGVDTDDFQDLMLQFWLFAVVYRLTDQKENPWPASLHTALATIAATSPVLVSPRAKQYFNEMLQTRASHIERKALAKDLFSFQAELIGIVGKGNAVVEAEIRRLSLAQTLYLVAVYRLENLRQSKPNANWYPSFAYITDPGVTLNSDTAGVAAAIVEVLYKEYLGRLRTMRPGRLLQMTGEELAIFFLVNFNHRNEFVKRQADKLLVQLTEVFPNLLWSDRVIVAALDLLDLLSATIDVTDPISTNVTIDLPYRPYVHVLPATKMGRERIVADFRLRCRNLLSLALTQAPEDAAGTLQSYISALIHRHLLSQNHPGLDVALLATTTSLNGGVGAAGGGGGGGSGGGGAGGVAASVAAGSGTASSSAAPGASNPGSGAISANSTSANSSSSSSSLMATFGPCLALRNHYGGQLEGILLAAALAAGAKTGTATAIVSAESRMVASAVPRRNSSDLPLSGSIDVNAAAAAVASAMPPVPPETLNGRVSRHTSQSTANTAPSTAVPPPPSTQQLDPSPFGQLPPPAPEQMMTPKAKGVLASGIQSSVTAVLGAQSGLDGGSALSEAGGSLATTSSVAGMTGPAAAAARPHRVAQPDQVQGLVTWAEDVLFRLRAITRGLVKGLRPKQQPPTVDAATNAPTDPTLQTEEESEVTLPLLVVQPMEILRTSPPTLSPSGGSTGGLAALGVAGAAHRRASVVPRSYADALQGQRALRDASLAGADCQVPVPQAVALFDEAMFQAAAVLAFRPPGWDPLSHTTSALEADLMEALVWAPVKIMEASVMQTAVACWSWLVAARPDSETRMMHDMQQVWFWCIEERRGLFSHLHGNDEGAEAPLEVSWTPAPSQSRGMLLWIEYLGRRLAVVDHRSLSQTQLISSMVNHALIHAKDWCRHPSMWTAKYKLIALALQLLHGPALTDSHHQLVLRARLFDAILLDFTHPPRSPATCDLKDTLEALFECHSGFTKDRNFCRPLDQRLHSATHGSSNAAATAGSGAPDGAIMPPNRRGTGTFLGRHGGGSSNVGSSSGINIANNAGNNRAAPAGPQLNTIASSSFIGGAMSTASTSASTAALNSPHRSKADSTTGSDALASIAQSLRNMGLNRFTRKCELLLWLLRDEINRLSAWYNPQSLPERMLPQEAALRLKKPPSDTTLVEYVRLAWSVRPALTIQLALRFPASDAIQHQVQRLVRGRPDLVSHIPEALRFLLTKANVEHRVSELSQVLTWAPVSPATALYLLWQFPGHPTVSQYCLRLLKSIDPLVILFYTPQLIQALRHDPKGYMEHFLLEVAVKSQLLAHQMIWNMKTNMFMDEHGQEPDPVLHDVLERLVNKILERMPPRGRQFYQREFEFFDQITGVSGKIRDKPIGPLREQACLEELAKIQLRTGCYLPSSPDGMVVAIDYKSAKPMQSAAKAPYIATFSVIPYGYGDMERMGQTVSEQDGAEEGGKGPGQGQDSENKATENGYAVATVSDPPVRVQSCLFKVGDDVRQDMMTLQIMELFRNIYRGIGLDVTLYPYRVVATSPGCGVIEIVPNAKSRHQLGKATDASLYKYFLKIYGDEDSPAFQRARRNFLRSMAAYSVLSYLLQIKDRHNANILISRDGALVQIDFGFLLESSPGGNIGFEPDIKLTQEMVDIMGGSSEAEPYNWFVDQCIRAYLAVRPYSEQFVSLVAMMLESGLPCFRTAKVLDALRERFATSKSAIEAAAQMKGRIQHCYKHWRTSAYDALQAFQNAIAY